MRLTTFTLQCPLGSGVIETDSSDERLHGVRRLLDHGKPFRSWSRLLAKDWATGGVRWIGNFVHSQGGRLLFFPLANLEGAVGEEGDWTAVDHLSLESARGGALRSHWTFKKPPQGRRRPQAGGLNHRAAESGAVFWFSILATELRRFSDAPAELRVMWNFSRPKPPAELLAGNWAAAEFPARPDRSHFYQLDLWVVPEGLERERLPGVPWFRRVDLMVDRPPAAQRVTAVAAHWRLPTWPGYLAAVASTPQGKPLMGGTIVRGAVPRIASEPLE